MSKGARVPIAIVQRLAGPAADEVGKMLRDRLRPYRAARQCKLIGISMEMIRRCGVDPVEVPPRILLPILEYAAVEDQDSLVTAWAALLANAAMPARDRSITPVLVETLKGLSATETTFLLSLPEYIDHLRGSETDPWEFSAAQSIDIGTDVDLLVKYLKMGLGRPTETREQALKNIPGDLRDFMAILDNLGRLNLVSYRLESEAPGWGAPSGLEGIDPVRVYHLTMLGYQFIRACQAPCPKKSSVV
jgi:hypothetical protein